MRNSSNATKTLGELIDKDKFSFADVTVGTDEIYVVIEQLKELTSIKAQHGTYLFCLAKHLKVYKHV